MKLLLLIDTMIHYDRELLKGVKSGLDELNMNITIHIDTAENASYLLSTQWDYVIADFDKPNCAQLIESISGKKVVYANSKAHHIPDHVLSILTDNAHIAHIALGHFIHDGLVNVCTYSDPSEQSSNWALERRQAFSSRALASGCYYHSDAIEAIRSNRDQLGVFCTSDRSARKFIRYCIDNNIRVPQQVSIIGTDFDELERDLSPIPITSIELNPKRLGRECVELVFDLNPRVKHKMHQANQLHSYSSTSSDKESDDVVNQAILFIHNHYHRNIKVEQITDHCRISRKTLDKRFIEIKSKTVHQYLSDLRIEKSQELLRDTSISIDSIARQCGYPGQSYLNQLYRKSFGYTPHEYRQKSARP